MCAREEKGKEIAATTRIVKKGSMYQVPSQSNGRKYIVCMDGDTPHCSCPDHESRKVKCKHIFAVEFTLIRERSVETATNAEGETTTTVTEKVTKQVRVTYKQNWPAYNAAQTKEKALFLSLLHDLCSGVTEPEQTFGRPRLLLSDTIFAAAFKVYSTVSGRRFTSDLQDAFEKGYLTKAPHFNSVFKCLEREDVTPILKALIMRSSLPLKMVERDFAVDSSGFGTCRFEKWFDEKYGKERSEHEWVKMHLMCGVKTNIVTSVEISGRYEHDSPFFAGLVDQTAQNFTLGEVSADRGYPSKENLKVVVKHGGTPYVQFKSNHTGESDCDLWNKMYHYYQFSRDAFMEHYHKRSNVESTFSMIKAKFGDALRSKSDTAQDNEALCKVLCHNICVVIQSIFELGIEPTFAMQKAAA